MRVYLIRHAEEGEGGHISSQGRNQAEKLGEWLGNKTLRAIFSSDRLRAKETAEIAAAKLNFANQIIPNFEEVRELNLDETDEDIAHRAQKGLRSAVGKAAGGNSAIIAHSKLIRQLLATLNLKAYQEDDPDLPNAGVVTLGYQDGKYQLLEYGVSPD